MRVDHEVVEAADAGHPVALDVRPPVHRDEFAKRIAVADLSPGRLALVGQVLRLATDDGTRPDSVAATHDERADQVGVGPDDAVEAERDRPLDDRVRADLDAGREIGLGRHDGRRVDAVRVGNWHGSGFRATPATRAPGPPAATRLLSGFARAEPAQIGPRCRILMVTRSHGAGHDRRDPRTTPRLPRRRPRGRRDRPDREAVAGVIRPAGQVEASPRRARPGGALPRRRLEARAPELPDPRTTQQLLARRARRRHSAVYRFPSPNDWLSVLPGQSRRPA